MVIIHGQNAKNRNEIGSLKQKLRDDIYPSLDMSTIV